MIHSVSHMIGIGYKEIVTENLNRHHLAEFTKKISVLLLTYERNTGITMYILKGDLGVPTLIYLMYFFHIKIDPIQG